VPVPITAIDIPRRVTAIASDSPGTVLLRWGKTEGARMFRVERSITDPVLGDPIWTFVVMTSRQRYLASGQEPYRPYWFRVIALGKEKEGLPSDVVLGRAV
jgi:hypothetical protein